MATSLVDLVAKQSTTSTINTLHKIFPIGSFFITQDDQNPSLILGFGSWERIENRMLIGAGDQYTVGSEGGSSDVTLTVNNLPSHNHTASTNDVGAHTHTRGTMDITGTFSLSKQLNANFNLTTATGAFSSLGQYGASNSIRNTADNATSQALAGFTASKSWTGATSSNGSHTHTVTINNTGSGSAIKTISPYLAVFIWRRIA